VASLAADVGAFLCPGSSARSAGTLSDGQCVELWGQAWEALGAAARAQGDHQASAEPTQRFVELLRSAIASGRAHVARPDGNRPDASERTRGWRLNPYGTYEPQGDRVGWLEGDGLYLDPDASYAAAQSLGHNVGDRLAVIPHTLRKRLKERGLLFGSDEQRQRLTVRRSFEASAASCCTSRPKPSPVACAGFSRDLHALRTPCQHGESGL